MYLQRLIHVQNMTQTDDVVQIPDLKAIVTIKAGRLYHMHCVFEKGNSPFPRTHACPCISSVALNAVFTLRVVVVPWHFTDRLPQVGRLWAPFLQRLPLLVVAQGVGTIHRRDH